MIRHHIICFTIFVFLCSFCAPLRNEILASERQSLTLKQCIQLAYRNHPALQAKKYEIDMAKGNVITERSAFLPQIKADVAIQHFYENPGASVPAGEIGNPAPLGLKLSDKTVPRYSVTLDQILYDFGKSTSRYRQAKIGQRIQQLEASLFEQDLALQVVQVYYGVSLAEERLKVARSSEKALSEHYRTVKGLYDQQVVSKNDLLTANVAMSQAALAVKDAENDLEVIRLTFQKIVGIEPMNLSSSLFSYTHLSEDFKDIIDQYNKSRLEVVINEKQQEAALSKKQAATSNYLPTVFARAQTSYTDDSYRLHKDEYSAMAGLSWPLFDGLSSLGKRRSATAELKALQSQKDAVVDQIEVEVKRAFLALKQSNEAIKVAKMNKGQAEENLRLYRERFVNETASATDVLDAEALWTKACYSYAESFYNYKLANARLYRAAGQPITGEQE